MTDVTWKKRKDISGVSNTTIVNLKAALAESTLTAKRFKQSGQKAPKPVLSQKSRELYASKANKGVADRAKKDELSFEEEQEGKSWEKAQEKLREKSKLYEQMVRGGTLTDYDDEKGYLVDFESKNWNDESTHLESNPSKMSLFSDDLDTEEQRRRWEKEIQDEIEYEKKRSERRQLAESVSEETKHARQKLSEVKERRKQEMQERLKMIKDKGLQRKGKEEPAQELQEEQAEQVVRRLPQTVAEQIDELFRTVQETH